MADESTRRALASVRRIRYGVTVGFGICAGLLARAILGFDPLNSLWLLYEAWINAVPSAESWLRSNVIGQSWSSWLSGPLFLALILAGLARTRIGTKALESIVRDPPWFAASDLDEERRRTMLNLEREPLPFVGREPLLSELEEFGSGRAGFAWRMVVGPSGIGKTRLGIEWLEQMRKPGWDIGVVRTGDIDSLRGWRSRKPTALFVDDARRLWDNRLGELLERLEEGSAIGRSVRVLVADQSIFAIELGLAGRRERLMELHSGTPLRVPVLPEAEIVLIQEHAGSAVSDAIAHAAAGRPRALLIMLRSPQSDSYASALHHWVLQMVPGLLDDSDPFPLAVGGPLLLSSLAGPIPMSKVRVECGDIDTVPLTRFYDEADAFRLAELLPLLEPDDLAAALVVQLLPRLDGDRRSSLVRAALSWNIATVEARLVGLSEWQGDKWANSVSDSHEVLWLRWLENRFDEFAPYRVEAVRSAARQLLQNALQAPTLEGKIESVEDLCDLARSRPFDPEIRSLECDGVATVIRVCGADGQYEAMALWANRLLEFLPMLQKLKNRRLNFSIVGGIMAAADACANAGHGRDLKAWKDRLDAVTDSLSEVELHDLRAELAGAYASLLHGLGLNHYVDDMEETGRRIRSLTEGGSAELQVMTKAALACTHALCVYGQFARISDMKRWMAELIELAHMPRFELEPEIRLLEATGLADAMGHFGPLKLFDELEDCGSRLLQIVDNEPFSDDLRFRLRQAEGSCMAIKYYGEAGNCRALERWGERLNTLAEDPRYEADPEMRGRQLHGIVSATRAYGPAGQLDDLLRWAEIGFSVATDPRFAMSDEVQDVASSLAVNVTNRTGEARRFDEMEKWGRELVRLSEEATFFDHYNIQHSVARGAANIISRLSTGGGSQGDFMRWMGFLARHAQHYPSHIGVQEVATMFNLTLTEQLLEHFRFGRFEPRSLVSGPPPRRSKGHSERSAVADPPASSTA